MIKSLEGGRGVAALIVALYHLKIGAEYFSVILEGVCIVLAALSIVREALVSFLHPSVIDAPLAGLLVSGLGTVLNAGWGALLVRQGRAARSSNAARVCSSSRQ